MEGKFSNPQKIDTIRGRVLQIFVHVYKTAKPALYQWVFNVLLLCAYCVKLMPRVRIELTTFRWLFHVIMRLTRCLLRYRGMWTELQVTTNGCVSSQLTLAFWTSSKFQREAWILRIFEFKARRFCGVMVSTLDSESSDPSSNLGRTSLTFGQQKGKESHWWWVLLCSG